MTERFTHPELAALRVLVKTRIKHCSADQFDTQKNMVGSAEFWTSILSKLSD